MKWYGHICLFVTLSVSHVKTVDPYLMAVIAAIQTRLATEDPTMIPVKIIHS